MPVLDQLRCTFRGCDQAFTFPGGPTQLLLEAWTDGWRFEGEHIGVLVKVRCPEHSGAWHQGIRWIVGCYTCDWSTEDEDEDTLDDEDYAYTEAEAKTLARNHDCRDYMETYSETWMKSPEQQEVERARIQEYQQERFEKERTKRREEREAAAELEARRERAVNELRLVKAKADAYDRWDAWAPALVFCVVIGLIAMYLLGYVTH